jgi:poly(3-hydroxyalkanoate) synthetase
VQDPADFSGALLAVLARAAGQPGQVAEAAVPADPAGWRSGAQRRDGSWWEDWATWADTRSGTLVGPPPMGSQRYPALAGAPGRYVLE